jgi:hypothetical protein
VTEVAPVTVQLNVEDCPAVMVEGDAVKLEITGDGTFIAESRAEGEPVNSNVVFAILAFCGLAIWKCFLLGLPLTAYVIFKLGYRRVDTIDRTPL